MSPRVPWQIDTPRLALLGPEPQRAEIVNDAVRKSLAELRPWMPWAEEAELEQTRSYLTQAALDFEARNCFHWNMVRRDPHAPAGAAIELTRANLIGACGFPRLDWAVPMFEIGYWLRTGCTGQGYMTEAVSALTRLALDELGARRVEIRTSSRNGASGRVAERCGYALEATLRNHRREKDGALGDTLVFALYR